MSPDPFDSARRALYGLIILQFLWTGSELHGQANSGDLARIVDGAVLAEMERQKLVGVSVGIIQNSRVVYTQGYGFANLKTRVPVDDNSIFNWASNSKPFMAVAAMQLIQNGQLELDKPIETYIPDLPDHVKPITTRQLLCHQSGIPHYTNGKIVSSGKKVDVHQELDPLNAINRFVMSPLIFEPGTKTDYSSHAYVLLSAVVQSAGKEPIDRQLLMRIGKPLNLKSMQLDVPFDGQKNWVSAYRSAEGQPQEVPDYAHFWKHGAGGYKSDVKDFARFAQALMNYELISADTSKIMWTLQKTSTGETSTFGLGVSVEGKGKSLKISHGGSQDETKTRMVIYPNQKHGIVVMCNTQSCDPGQISTAIYKAINQR
ncbi:MAG TPA: serine hydrolase domain-containing protein [Pirellulaceae bacterium]|nr:serine hydrolase domain-containing protein [Pirellulaceae bacterium]HMO91341.1 serine hydrolase domain-containing protein [Pirellulaceae bacterium]HMP70159.1 serine hydrolase domain-containing protein [Pirellulaceae bacterium]